MRRDELEDGKEEMEMEAVPLSAHSRSHTTICQRRQLTSLSSSLFAPSRA